MLNFCVVMYVLRLMRLESSLRKVEKYGDLQTKRVTDFDPI